eukprot:g1751.t1
MSIPTSAYYELFKSNGIESVDALVAQWDTFKKVFATPDFLPAVASRDKDMVPYILEQISSDEIAKIMQYPEKEMRDYVKSLDKTVFKAMKSKHFCEPLVALKEATKGTEEKVYTQEQESDYVTPAAGAGDMLRSASEM